MSGHTPGPWVVERADDAYCIANVGNLVIMPCGGKVKHDNAEADARLIAAAPDLLEALEQVCRIWDHHCDAHGDGTPSEAHARVRAAIAKART